MGLQVFLPALPGIVSNARWKLVLATHSLSERSAVVATPVELLKGESDFLLCELRVSLIVVSALF